MTIVIPAHNAARTLGMILERLLPQLTDEDELIIVDDGSTDATRSLVAMAVHQDARVRSVSLSKRRGAAAARNAGWAVARGAVVLFLGADILPALTLLARHRALHLRFPEATAACLGFVTWEPSLPPSPFMVWLEHGGGQNAYGLIAGQRWADPTHYCYGANFSLKRAMLVAVGGYNAQAFRDYGWEDLDLGRRLAARGVTLFTEPSARATHLHHRTLRSWHERSQTVGEGLVRYAWLYPAGTVRIPRQARGWRYAVRTLVRYSPVGALIRSAAGIAERRWILPRLYGWVQVLAFINGVHIGLRSQRWTVDKSTQVANRVPPDAEQRFSA